MTIISISSKSVNGKSSWNDYDDSGIIEDFRDLLLGGSQIEGDKIKGEINNNL